MRIKQPFSPRLLSFLFAGLLLSSALYSRLLAPRAAHAAFGGQYGSVVLVHGFTVDGKGFSGTTTNGSMDGNCDAYWGNAKAFLSSHWVQTCVQSSIIATKETAMIMVTYSTITGIQRICTIRFTPTIARIIMLETKGQTTKACTI
jgi:hypothetical protein